MEVRAFQSQEWMGNVKEGHGRHTFDDGKVYDGSASWPKLRSWPPPLCRKFEVDRMVEYSTRHSSCWYEDSALSPVHDRLALSLADVGFQFCNK